MKKTEKIIIAGVGAILVYLFLHRNEGKTLNISNMSISPMEFYE